MFDEALQSIALKEFEDLPLEQQKTMTFDEWLEIYVPAYLSTIDGLSETQKAQFFDAGWTHGEIRHYIHLTKMLMFVMTITKRHKLLPYKNELSEIAVCILEPEKGLEWHYDGEDQPMLVTHLAQQVAEV